MKMTYFVHGATSDNETGRCSGQSDIGLSDLGKKQNQELKELLDGKKFDLVVSSDLKRAKETAKFVFSDQKIVYNKRLRECNYGKLNSESESKFNPDPYYYIDHQHPNGESYHDVEKRIKNLLDDISKKYRDKNIAFVSHMIPQLALEVLLKDKTWRQAIDEDWRKTNSWQPGWEYILK